MGKSYEALSGADCTFIAQQPLFFCATAVPEGRVNMSPKGLDALRVLGPDRIVWLNLTGSGNETAAHILQNPRMTLMFCAFAGAANILRVYGLAKMVQPDDEGWEELAGNFPDYPAQRQIFDLKIELVQNSCGMGIPHFSFEAPRAEEELLPYFDKLGPERTRAYQQKKNTKSLDGFDTGLPT